MTRTTSIAITLSLAVAGGAFAQQQPLPEPDIILHGAITAGGAPIDPTQTSVVVYAMADGADPRFDAPLATYTVGDNPLAFLDVNGNSTPDGADEARYVLRIPMQYLPPGAVQGPGAVILDDVIDLWVDPATGTREAVGSFTVTARGLVEQATLVVGAVPCPNDCDGSSDGTIGINDLLALLATWNNPGPCDFDDDNTVSITDLLQLLAAWGPCR